MERYFKIPKPDEPYWCSNYMPRQSTSSKIPKGMQDIKKTPEEEKKKLLPEEWKNNPCLLKNHDFNKAVDLPRAPALIPEQVHEYLLVQNYEYHQKIVSIKDDFVKTIIKDPYFEVSASGYWNVKFSPILYPEIFTETLKAKMDKRAFFCLALFHADFLKLSLEQMLIDETLKKDQATVRLEEAYVVHMRIRCMIAQSMAQMSLAPDVIDYSKGIKRFRYREIAGRTITNLRTLITLRSCYLFSIFVWRILWIFRFDPK